MSAVGDKNLLTKAMSEKEVKHRETQQIRRRTSFLRHGTSAFFRAKLKKRNLTLVMWCIITHPSAFSRRQQSGRDHPLRPPGADGNAVENANDFMKREIQETCVMPMRRWDTQTAARQHLKDAQQQSPANFTSLSRQARKQRQLAQLGKRGRRERRTMG
jgi:hypothetical protein